MQEVILGCCDWVVIRLRHMHYLRTLMLITLLSHIHGSTGSALSDSHWTGLQCFSLHCYTSAYLCSCQVGIENGVCPLEEPRTLVIIGYNSSRRKNAIVSNFSEYCRDLRNNSRYMQILCPSFQPTQYSEIAYELTFQRVFTYLMKFALRALSKLPSP